MVVKARDDVTVATLNDVAMVLPYYLTQSNTASAPATPTTNPPTGGWTNAEPTYNSSNTVYMSFLTVFSDGSFDWSTPFKSSNYEAAKAAYNKATSAYDAANNAQTSANQAIFAALPSTADNTQANSWLCAIFPTGTGSVQPLPSYSLIASLGASDTKYHADSGDIINGSGMDYHYGLIRTLVSFAADTTWTFTYSHDDGSRIYIDGVLVFENANYTLNDSVTITFTRGNHIVDIMYSNFWGGYGIWGFSVPLSSIATTMYAPAGASALVTTLDKAQTAANLALANAQEATAIANAAQATAQGAQTTANGKNKIVLSTSAPSSTSGYSSGDQWWVYSGETVTALYLYSGSAWVSQTLTNSVIANLDAGKITSGYVDTARIAAGSITADKADIGSLASAIVTSGQFQTASSGARVKMDSSGITGYDSNDSTTFKIDSTTGDVSMIGKLYSGNPSISRVVIDDDYNNIDNPAYVGIDGYVAFENPKSDISPFIGGTHGTQTGTSYTGTIMTSGVTDSSHPAAASVQLISTGTDGGNTQGGSEGAIVATLNKDDTSKSAAQVHVHSGSDGQVAALMAYDGTDNTNNAAVKVYVDSDGNHNVDIVATQIFRVDPLTGHVTELIVSDTGWVDIKSCLANGISGTMNVRVKDGIVYIDIDCSGFSIPPYATTAIAHVPSQYLPKRPGMNTYVATGTSTWYSGIVRIESNGDMWFQNMETSNATSCRCSFTPYILD